MSMRPSQTVCFVALALLSGGCFSAANTVWLTPEENGQRVYGGVRLHLERLASDETRDRDVERHGRLGLALFTLVDFPLSLFGDTFALPFTVPYALGWFGPDRPVQTTGVSPAEPPSSPH